MALIRHIAGIPTASEQRCVRCCEPVNAEDEGPSWPGAEVWTGSGPQSTLTDCQPHDAKAVGGMNDETRATLDALIGPAKVEHDEGAR